MREALTINIKGSKPTAIRTLLECLNRHKIEVLRDLILFTNNTVVFTDGIYNIPDDQIVIELRPKEGIAPELTKSLQQCPDIVLS